MYHKDPKSIQNLGKHVVVVGGGNTAMDSSRAAKTIDGVESVSVVYRRTVTEMPADREEYEEAMADGVKFMFLTNPEEFYADGRLKCRIMKLGELDQSGRRRPVPTDEIVELRADAVITAIGENVDINALSASGLKMGAKGWPEVNEETLETIERGVFLIGDAHTGPSTIVECIAEARKAADAICKKEDPTWSRETSFRKPFTRADMSQVVQRKGILKPSLDPKSAYDVETFANVEGARCLECSYVCNKCVDVCPNRANIAIPVESGNGFQDLFQVLHIDAYCNECGNCETFCPYAGKPYLDKLTIFNLAEDFEQSENNGFLIKNSTVTLRLGSDVYTMNIDSSGVLSGSEVLDDTFENAKRLIGKVYTEYPYLLGPVGI
jgi:putative selenate reductase